MKRRKPYPLRCTECKSRDMAYVPPKDTWATRQPHVRCNDCGHQRIAYGRNVWRLVAEHRARGGA